MGWRDYAKEKQEAGHNRYDRHKSPGSDPIVPIVPIVPGVLPLDPSRVLSGWRSALCKLDPCAPCGMSTGLWQTLFDSAVWWLEGFGRQAALDGWGTGDVFGIRDGYPGTGGLIERLGDNRSLVMAEGRACWRSRGVPMQFNRGGGDGLPAFWEIAT